MKNKTYFLILVVAVLLLFPSSIPRNATAQNDGHMNFNTTPITPEILGYSIKSQSSSLVMNGNGSIYIYTAVDGGGVSITGENFNVINSVIDGNGVISAVTGNSTSNLGQFNSNNIAIYAIGGISIGSSTGVNSNIPFEGIYSYSNGAYAANHVNGTFKVNSSGSLVVIVAAGSTNDNPIFTGNFSFKQLDELNSSISIVQDYAVLNEGTYSISVNMTNDGQNLNGCSVIMEVYVIGKSVFYPPHKYPVTFTESGLPSGTTWSVSLGNQTMSSSNNTIIFSEYNGTYSYSIPAISGLYPSPNSGYVTVAGNPLSLAINFLPPSTYVVSFVPENISSSTIWWVVVGNSNKSATGATPITFDLINGSYNYTTGVQAGYTSTPSQGNFVVSGSSQSITIIFSAREYTLTIFERGLPVGTTWYVVIAGNSYSSSTSSLTVLITDGNYTVIIPGIEGYRPVTGSMKVVIDNSNETLEVYYNFVSPAGLSLMYSPDIMVVLSIIILVILGFISFVILRGGKDNV